MQVIYAQEPFPNQVISSIFLAGPTPRTSSVPSWRPLALALLEELGYEGAVFVPEPRAGVWRDYTNQVEWETEGLNRSDCALFWIPRDLRPDENGYPRMGALTTNDEWGAWKTSGKVVLGTPPPTREMHVKYQRYYADKYGAPLCNALDDTVRAALKMVTPGAQRTGTECQVPLHVWRTPAFQSWYQALVGAGNRLEKARVAWSLNIESGFPILWTLTADIFVTTEDRHESREVIVGRPDISTVVLWCRGPSLRETEIVLVKEFRAAGRTPDGFVRTVPGGSSKDHGDPFQTAVDELREEAGLAFPPNRLLGLAPRQVAASLSSFSANCFVVEVTAAEMAQIKTDRGAHGVASDGERTYIEVATVGDLIDNPVTDWATLGMIFAALARAMR